MTNGVALPRHSTTTMCHNSLTYGKF